MHLPPAVRNQTMHRNCVHRGPLHPHTVYVVSLVRCSRESIEHHAAFQIWYMQHKGCLILNEEGDQEQT